MNFHERLRPHLVITERAPFYLQCHQKTSFMYNMSVTETYSALCQLMTSIWHFLIFLVIFSQQTPNETLTLELNDAAFILFAFSFTTSPNSHVALPWDIWQVSVSANIQMASQNSAPVFCQMSLLPLHSQKNSQNSLLQKQESWISSHCHNKWCTKLHHKVLVRKLNGWFLKF